MGYLHIESCGDQGHKEKAKRKLERPRSGMSDSLVVVIAAHGAILIAVVSLGVSAKRGYNFSDGGFVRVGWQATTSGQPFGDSPVVLGLARR